MDTDMTDWLTWMRQRVIDRLPPLTKNNVGDVGLELLHAAELLLAIARLPPDFWEDRRISAPATEIAPAPERHPGYRMTRRLRGGYLPELGVVIPEAAVRKLNAAHGDYIWAEPVGTFPDGKRKYRFSVAEHLTTAPADERERIEVAYGIVDADQGALVVKRTATGPLPVPVALALEDIQYLNIGVGDVVDLSYWADDPDTVRVCWVHRQHSGDSSDGAADPSKPVARKAIAAAPVPRSPAGEENPSDWDDLPRGALDGKRVLVVGCQPKRWEYEAAIRRLGGEMEWVEGTEGQARLEAAIRRVDGVVLLTRFIRHQSFWDATALAKGHGVKVVACPKLGIRSVSQAAVNLLASNAYTS